MAKNAILYLRVNPSSSDAKNLMRYQRDKLRVFCKEHGYEIDGTIMYSGAGRTADSFFKQAASAAIKKKTDILVATNADRFTRNCELFRKVRDRLKKNGVELTVCDLAFDLSIIR